MNTLYEGRDPREVPAYSVGTAAYLLDLSPRTLRDWVAGRSYPRARDVGYSLPLIELPSDAAQLSFLNLIEAHVLSAIRRVHHVPLPNVRRALDYVRREMNTAHPLVERLFETDGVDLFIRESEALVNVSRGGQVAMRELIAAHLQRVERDDSGLPVRLFPFVRDPDANARQLAQEPRAVMIDPRIQFGKPVISGTGISTAVIAGRYKAGEPILELAEDFLREPHEIENAIRYELRLRAA